MNNVELYIIGANDGEYKEEYRKVMDIAKDKGIEEHVHCLGYQSNPYKFVKYANCFALSSRWEGLPNALVEALYLGVPVAATTCVPIVERLVKEGENGFLAKKEDPMSLMEAMCKAVQLENPHTEYDGAAETKFKDLF